MAEESTQQHTGEFATPAAYHCALSQDDTPQAEMQPPPRRLHKVYTGRVEAKPSIDNTKQWVLLIVAIVWLFGALALTGSIFYLTRDLRSLMIGTFTTPPIAVLGLLYRRHFPPSAQEYRLKELKLRLKFAAMQKQEKTSKECKKR